ncbi:unnamed protein product, partial [Phaeothamnion confervicola]
MERLAAKGEVAATAASSAAMPAAGREGWTNESLCAALCTALRLTPDCDDGDKAVGRGHIQAAAGGSICWEDLPNSICLEVPVETTDIVSVLRDPWCHAVLAVAGAANTETYLFCRSGPAYTFRRTALQETDLEELHEATVAALGRRIIAGGEETTTAAAAATVAAAG